MCNSSWGFCTSWKLGCSLGEYLRFKIVDIWKGGQTICGQSWHGRSGPGWGRGWSWKRSSASRCSRSLDWGGDDDGTEEDQHHIIVRRHGIFILAWFYYSDDLDMEICPPEREAVGGQPTLHVDGRQRKSTEEKWEFDKYYKHGGGDDRNDDDAPGQEKGDVGGVDETGKQRRSRRRRSHLCFYLRFCSKNML